MINSIKEIHLVVNGLKYPKKNMKIIKLIMKTGEFNYFVNNVYCRRDSNQYKAHKMWNEIKVLIPNDVRSLFETEWNHYCMSEFEPDKFGMDINILKPYFT